MTYKKQPEKTIKGQMSKANDKAVKAYNLTTRENILNDPTCPKIERVARPGCCSFCDSKAGFYSRPSEDNEHSHRDCKCVEIPRLKNGCIKYTKPRGKLTSGEKIAVDTFKDYGYSIITLNEIPDAKANLDFIINKKLYEHKNVTSESSVSSQINRARKKFMIIRGIKPRYIFTSDGAKVKDEVLINAIAKRVHKGERALFVSNGMIISI